MIALPEKHFYTIGDISKVTGVKPHILRYWESQFKLLRPARRYSGHRKFTQTDIDLINKIKFLIVDKRFTLAGAKREISRQLSGKPQVSSTGQTQVSALPLLQEIKKEIESCLDILGPGEKQLELLKSSNSSN